MGSKTETLEELRKKVIEDAAEQDSMSIEDAADMIDDDLSRVPERNRREWLRRWTLAPKLDDNADDDDYDHYTDELVAFLVGLDELYDKPS